MTAVAYLLGKEQGGADCVIEGETIYKQKPTEQYAKPSVKLVNEGDMEILNTFTEKMPKRERP